MRRVRIMSFRGTTYNELQRQKQDREATDQATEILLDSTNVLLIRENQENNMIDFLIDGESHSYNTSEIEWMALTETSVRLHIPITINESSISFRNNNEDILLNKDDIANWNQLVNIRIEVERNCFFWEQQNERATFLIGDQLITLDKPDWDVNPTV